MGKMLYGGGHEIEIEDRALAHVKVVIATKLRRQESFTLSWKNSPDEPGGRSTIWLHPSVPLRFIFDAVQAPELNPQWISDLMHTANATGDLTLVDEPEPRG